MSNSSACDSWCWRGSPNGDYTVKLGYRSLAYALNQTGHHTIGINWKQLWETQVPSKVKNFLWRACKGCLPVSMNLVARSVSVSLLCPLCNEDDESTIHALVSCPKARQVWNLSGLNILCWGLNDFATWWSQVCSSLRVTEISVAATLLWAIWGSRNKVVWTGKSEAATIICSRAMGMLSQWQSAQVSPTGAVSPEGSLHVIKWSKPIQGKFKCNVDAAVFSSTDNIGFGGIVRNHLGAMLGAINGTLCAPADPLLAEALGCREVLRWLKTEAYS
ncbi:hypothetical protein LguiB_003680 [Lonicera macranthoides]